MNCFYYNKNIPTIQRKRSYLHQVDKMQKEFLGILLSIWGELWMAFADQSLKHSGRNPSVLLLQSKKFSRHWKVICELGYSFLVHIFPFS